MREAPLGIEAALDLVDAAVYADAFDAAVTFEELHRFARAPVSAGRLEELLAEDPLLRRLVAQHPSGAYTLVGRERLADGFTERAARTEGLRRRASRVGRVLRHTPFVRGLMLTGSVAASAAPEGADVDLLVLVAEERVGTVFALLGTVSRLVGRNVFCPNFYLSHQHLAFERRSVYVGHELAQVRSVVGETRSLHRANPWLAEMFPNLPEPQSATVPPRSPVQAALEALLRGRLGRGLEQRARRLARARLHAHYAGTVPDEIVTELRSGLALRFHASDVEHSAPERYVALRRELAIVLAERAATGRGSQAGRSS